MSNSKVNIIYKYNLKDENGLVRKNSDIEYDYYEDVNDFEISTIIIYYILRTFGIVIMLFFICLVIFYFAGLIIELENWELPQILIVNWIMKELGNPETPNGYQCNVYRFTFCKHSSEVDEDITTN